MGEEREEERQLDLRIYPLSRHLFIFFYVLKLLDAGFVWLFGDIHGAGLPRKDSESSKSK